MGKGLNKLKKYLPVAILLIIILTASVFAVPPARTEGLVLVAHAGGAIYGYPDSNSLEAIKNAAAAGFRYIELDMITTSDGKIVLNHSWELISNRIPGVRNGIMTYKEFMSHRIFNQFTPVNLDMLIEFLRYNPHPRIITDTKDTDYAALYAIAQRFPEYKHRFIPQVYAKEDVARIRALGFDDIILTIYMMPHSQRNPSEIHRFAVDNHLYAVTVPDPYFISQLNTNEVRYMTHTINDITRARQLHEMGFYAVYTAFLQYTYDRLGITRAALPVQAHANQINLNKQNLNPLQRALLPMALFYRINHTAYVHRGETSPIWAYYLATAPFESPLTGQVYLVAANFRPYREYQSWNPAEHRLYIINNGYTRTVEAYDVFIYRDMLFISETAVRENFSFAVLRDGDYIAVVPQKFERFAKLFLGISRALFIPQI